MTKGPGTCAAGRVIVGAPPPQRGSAGTFYSKRILFLETLVCLNVTNQDMIHNQSDVKAYQDGAFEEEEEE